MRRTSSGWVPVLAASLVLFGCDRGPDGTNGGPTGDLASLTIESVASPAPVGTGEPNVAAGPDGYYLSWLEQRDEGRHALRFAKLTFSGDTPGTWSEPVTILERENLFVNWADFPSLLALENDLVAAHWLEKSGPGTYAYDVRMAISTDGGATWGTDVIPHRDGVQAEHGFVSLFPASGRVGAVWLDGRETVHGDPMTLRYTTVGPDGADPETLLDASVCDCCQTAATLTADGPVVVYRGRTPDEIRDIRIVRSLDGEWTQPVPVHRDGWEIDACPVNGPAIDAMDDRVVVTWFTGAAPDGPRVLAAFSDDAGATFDPPMRLDDGGAMGRVDVLLLNDGTALASWVATGDDGAGIMLRRFSPDDAGEITRLDTTSPERASGFPRMARAGDHVLFAWTEAGDTPRVRTAMGTVMETSP